MGIHPGGKQRQRLGLFGRQYKGLLATAQSFTPLDVTMVACNLALNADRRLANSKSKSSDLVPGYSEDIVKAAGSSPAIDLTQRKAMLEQKAWDVVKSGGKQIPQQLFMMWMIGG